MSPNGARETMPFSIVGTPGQVFSGRLPLIFIYCTRIRAGMIRSRSVYIAPAKLMEELLLRTAHIAA